MKLVELAFAAGAAFLVLYAAIGVCFFGWDVSKAKDSIQRAQNETYDLMKELRSRVANLRDLQERLEQLGAEQDPSSDSIPAERTNASLILAVMAQSKFKWTTIKKLERRTSLTREQILEEVRRMPQVRIGHGTQSNDFIFTFQES